MYYIHISYPILHMFLAVAALHARKHSPSNTQCATHARKRNCKRLHSPSHTPHLFQRIRASCRCRYPCDQILWYVFFNHKRVLTAYMPTDSACFHLLAYAAAAYTQGVDSVCS